uniref:Tubuliform spidroin 1 n=1 Tax=Argiope argentata TaxID=233271 RepID=UPI0019203C11|nr:Chain A, Tubuliform spidroin 1 [Argiope argentata]6TV5_B Chain B, Tubuliform spidroin 1 [Argiope argentata]
GAVTAVPSVFSSPNLASGFLQCLTFGIGNSPAFPTQEQQDLDAIAQVILNAVSTNTGATASARAQALSTALASSLTDLLIAESAESNYNNQLSELTGILSNCFIQTTGSDNPAFVSRIQSLISVLSQNTDVNIISTA